MDIEDRIKLVKENIKNAAVKAGRNPDDITLVGVTKTVDESRILKAIDAGVDDIGENRVQEFISKYNNIDRKVNWHLIGTLQTNKVKYIIDKVNLIHSLDRLSLAKEIDRRAGKINRKVSALLQVNIAKEDTKSGLFEEEIDEFLSNIVNYHNISIKGLMTIAPIAKDDYYKTVQTTFKRLRRLFENLDKRNYKNVEMKYLSMGMTNDYEIAIEEGANIVRVGRGIFGER